LRLRGEFNITGAHEFGLELTSEKRRCPKQLDMTAIDKMGRTTEILSIEPRGLNRVKAAAYIGVSSSLFDEMVVDGRMPKPLRVNTRTIWDRRELDEAFDALSDGAPNPFDEEAA
jgi:predicted DNA-binding transcriptional regulator AlpA